MKMFSICQQEAMKNHEDPSIIIKVFEGEEQDLDFFKDSFSYQVLFRPV